MPKRVVQRGAKRSKKRRRLNMKRRSVFTPEQENMQQTNESNAAPLFHLSEDLSAVANENSKENMENRSSDIDSSLVASSGKPEEKDSGIAIGKRKLIAKKSKKQSENSNKRSTSPHSSAHGATSYTYEKAYMPLSQEEARVSQDVSQTGNIPVNRLDDGTHENLRDSESNTSIFIIDKANIQENKQPDRTRTALEAQKQRKRRKRNNKTAKQGNITLDMQYHEPPELPETGNIPRVGDIRGNRTEHNNEHYNPENRRGDESPSSVFIPSKANMQEHKQPDKTRTALEARKRRKRRKRRNKSGKQENVPLYTRFLNPAELPESPKATQESLTVPLVSDNEKHSKLQHEGRISGQSRKDEANVKASAGATSASRKKRRRRVKRKSDPRADLFSEIPGFGQETDVDTTLVNSGFDKKKNLRHENQGSSRQSKNNLQISNTKSRHLNGDSEDGKFTEKEIDRAGSGTHWGKRIHRGRLSSKLDDLKENKQRGEASQSLEKREKSGAPSSETTKSRILFDKEAVERVEQKAPDDNLSADDNLTDSSGNKLAIRLNDGKVTSSTEAQQSDAGELAGSGRLRFAKDERLEDEEKTVLRHKVSTRRLQMEKGETLSNSEAESSEKNEKSLNRQSAKMQHGLKYHAQFADKDGIHPYQDVDASGSASNRPILSDVERAIESGSGKLKFSHDDKVNRSGVEQKSKIQRGTKYHQQFIEGKDNSQSGKNLQSAGKSTKQEQLASVVETHEQKKRQLKFEPDERPLTDKTGKKLDELKKKADQTAEKLENAQKKLSAKRRSESGQSADEIPGKKNRHLNFESDTMSSGKNKDKLKVKAQTAKKVITPVIHKGISKAHENVSEAENENVSVKAAHQAELAAEKAYRFARKRSRLHFQRGKTKASRRMSKLEKSSVKANTKLELRKLRDSNRIRGNAISRFMQKRRIKRQYAKIAREAKDLNEAANVTMPIIKKIIKNAASLIVKHPVATSFIGLIIVFFFLASSFMSVAANIANGTASSVVSTSYLASDQAISDIELLYTEWETELQANVGATASIYGGYDEYRYEVDDIGHDPFELMAFLTAVYYGFEIDDVTWSLHQIFNMQYQLSFNEIVETRIRTEQNMVFDPIANEMTIEDVEIPYDWRVMKVMLTAYSFSDVIEYMITTEQRDMIVRYMQTKGQRQYLGSPFENNWLPYVTRSFGYYLSISGNKEIYNGIDIGVPVGRNVMAGHVGTVRNAEYVSGYGYVVVLEGKDELITRYSHLGSISVSAGQEVNMGDVIGTSGVNGISLEIKKHGEYLNPIYFTETNDDGTGYVPPGEPGGVAIPPDPGGAMGDGSYAALIAEAEKYLGFPYVWGGSNPSTSFDCSGFVCWVLNHSGVASVGRTTAQGLFNKCIPISRENAQPGDLIFFTKTYSTSNPVTHVGIYAGGGVMIHCGKPIQYTSINTNYWVTHFYSFGRIR